MKKCTKCGETKPLRDFPSDVSRKDGKHPYCTACKIKAYEVYRHGKGKNIVTETRRKYAENNREAIKKARQEYRKTETGKRNKLESQKRERAKDPRKYIARARVQYDVQTGKRPRASEMKCHYCGGQASEYHHHKGYDKENRRDVIPVCTKCHTRETTRKD